MIAARHSMMDGKLPYDAEVEYLESNGTQYINTGIVPNNNSKADIVLSANMNGGSSSSSNVFGVSKYYTSSSITHSWYVSVSINNGISFSAASGGVSFVEGQVYSISIDSNAWYVYEVRMPDRGKTFQTQNVPAYLFGTNSWGGKSWSPSISNWTIRLYSFSMTGNSGASCKLIPVRRNGVGYMYDKVTRTLLSSPVGDPFVLGPDKQL